MRLHNHSGASTVKELTSTFSDLMLSLIPEEVAIWAHWLLILDDHREFADIRGELVGEDKSAMARHPAFPTSR